MPNLIPLDPYGPAKVGGDVLSWCTKCKMELAHVVVAMDGARPLKVICKTCKSTHKYKRIGDTTAAKAKSPKGARKTAPKTTVRVAELWEQKIAEKRASVPKTYSARNSFLAGDLIEHAQFGVGLVQEVRGPGKISVLFRQEEKVLVQGVGGFADAKSK